jgi:hypothetical protein
MTKEEAIKKAALAIVRKQYPNETDPDRHPHEKQLVEHVVEILVSLGLVQLTE